MSQQELSREVQEVRALFKEIVNCQGVGVESQPYTIFIENLRHPPYRLRRPIPVLIERNDEKAYATYFDLDMQGSGRDVPEALDDLCLSIIQYYEAVKDDIVDEQRRGSSQKYAHLKQIIEVETETNPWIEYAGMFAVDPDFEKVKKNIEAHRKELDGECDNG